MRINAIAYILVLYTIKNNLRDEAEKEIIQK